MNINEVLENSDLYKALRRSNYLKKCNHYDIKSGRLPLPRFTKLQNYILECFYTVNDLNNPSAYRIYLYLIRQIIGYQKKSKIEYYPKKIKKQLNIGNSFYSAIEKLLKKNMIILSYNDDYKYIALNPYPDVWNTQSIDRIKEITQKEKNALLGIQDNEFKSVSSSSWSSSSSSSQSFPSDENALDELLQEELKRL